MPRPPPSVNAGVERAVPGDQSPGCGGDSTGESGGMSGDGDGSGYSTGGPGGMSGGRSPGGDSTGESGGMSGRSGSCPARRTPWRRLRGSRIASIRSAMAARLAVAPRSRTTYKRGPVHRAHHAFSIGSTVANRTSSCVISATRSSGIRCRARRMMPANSPDLPAAIRPG